MISERITTLLSEQLNKEFYSGYLYISMASYFNKFGLHGFANWCTVQAKEEVDHGMIIFNYLNNCDSSYKFQNIPAPECDYKTPLEAIELAYAHEKSVTNSINCIKASADEFNDRMTSLFLDWYNQEQFEEEHKLRLILNQLKFCVDNKIILMLLDSKLAERTYVKTEYNF